MTDGGAAPDRAGASDAADRDLARVTADLLDPGRALDALSRLVTAAGLLALLLADAAVLPAVAVVVLGAAEAYLALRVGFDAALFRRFADGDLDPSRFDAALSRLGLRGAAGPPRPMADRAAGARRLIVLQSVALAAQLAAGVLGAVLPRFG